jgi:hypothetical protein
VPGVLRYELAFRTRSEAEYSLVALESALAEFELSINASKTRIKELPEPFDVTWTHEIASFVVRSDSAAQIGNDVLALVSKAADLAKRRPGALKYALRKCRDVDAPKTFWPVMQSLIWSATSSEPTTMAVALDLVVQKSRELGEPVNIDQASEVVGGLVAVNAAVHNSSEVAWALWAAIALEAPLPAESVAGVANLEDNFVALLALTAEEKGLIPADTLDRGKAGHPA